MDFLTVLDRMKKFILSSSSVKITHQCVTPPPFPRGRARPSAQPTVTNPYFYHRYLRNEGEPEKECVITSLPATVDRQFRLLALL